MGRTGLALGGGAVRGLAHLGVLKAFERHGIQIDRIVGTSMGGAIGGLYAAGISAGDIEQLLLRTPKYRLLDLGIRHRGLFAGNTVHHTINELLQSHGKHDLRIEQFPVEFRAIAVDLIRGKQVVLDEGELGVALRATTAFPGVFAPLMAGDQMLVDGGVLNNLPVEEVLGEDIDYVIAVEAERKHASLKLADYVIRPDVGSYAAFDFTKTQECIRAGEEAAEQSMEELKRQI